MAEIIFIQIYTFLTYALIIGVSLVNLASTLLLILWFIRRYYHIRNLSQEIKWPSVSIIKPICGNDNRVEENLKSYFDLDYPNFELNFCFENSFCPTISIVEKLIKHYPLLKTNIYIRKNNDTIGNKKILNTIEAYNNTKCEYIWFSDESILAEKHTLTSMIKQMIDKDLHLIHATPIWLQNRSIYDAINQNYFQNFHTRFNFLSQSLGLICISGMSFLTSKKSLTKAGGLEALVQYASEDFWIYQNFVDRNLSVEIAYSPAIQNDERKTIKTFFERFSRWAILRRHLNIFTTIFEFTYDYLILLTAIISHTSFVGNLFCWPPSNFILIFTATCFIVDYLPILLFRNICHNVNLIYFIIGWIISNLLIPYYRLKSIFKGSYINWRGKTIKITRATIILSIDELRN